MIDKIKNSFKGFDVNNLDFSASGSWPAGVKVICYILVFCVVLVLGAHYYISDKEQVLSTEIRREQQLKKQFATESNKVANLAGLRKQMADVEEQFKEIRRQLPTEKEVPGLLEDITNIGIESGLTINSIALQAERKERYYIELPIQISAQGTYHQVGSFVSGIAAIKRIVTLHDYSLTPTSEGMLSISITAKTYRNDDD